MDSGSTYLIFLFIEHEGGDGPASVGTVTSLAADMNSSMAPTVLILGAGNGMSGHRHSGDDESAGSNQRG